MRLHTALGIAAAMLWAGSGCGSDDGHGGQTATGGNSGAGSGGSGGSGGSASGGSGGKATGGSAGSPAGGSGGNASGGSGGSGSGGKAAGGSAGSPAGGSGGNASGGGGGASVGTGGAPQSGGAGGGDAGLDARDATGPGGDGGMRRDGGPGGVSGSGGAISSGGTTGSGGAGAGGGTGLNICKFSSGLNVAWVSFAGDVPNPQTATFTKIFQDTYSAGGRVVRWWFHTNGSVTPGYNSDGTVKKIQQSHIDGVKAILAAANAVGIGVTISLWSFDMAQDNAGAAAANNKNLMIQDSIRQSYVDNYLTDLVKGLKGTPGLYAYEIFNEPEGMSTTGWSTQWKIDISYIQKAVNQWTAAIKAADPTIPVTNGSQTMDYRSKYSDSALVEAGGKATGTLDFYEVHYYQVNGSGNNVFANPRSFWGLSDKKLVIGEFAAYANDTSPVAVSDSFTYLFTNGYDGAWAWSYTEGNSNYKWPSMQTPMKNLYTAQKDTVDACP
jgi:hypothetical protein